MAKFTSSSPVTGRQAANQSPRWHWLAGLWACGGLLIVLAAVDWSDVWGQQQPPAPIAAAGGPEPAPKLEVLTSRPLPQKPALQQIKVGQEVKTEAGQRQLLALPGGAVRPAMKPAIGLLRPRFASSWRNCAASSSAEPPISPIMMID